MKKEQSTTKGGFLLAEVILSSALLGLFASAFIGAYLYGEESVVLSGNRIQAILMAEEGLEAVHNIRDHSFTNLTDGRFGLSVEGEWNLSGSYDEDGIFKREIIISANDADRKMVTVNVTWQQNPQREGVISLTSLLTNWREIAIEEPVIEE